jgi:hypothetical protein
VADRDFNGCTYSGGLPEIRIGATPADMAVLDTVLPHALQLVSRDDSGPFHGKTPEEWATEGRYNYPPSFAAAIIFCILFGAVLILHVVQFFWHRAWFWWVLIFGVVCKASHVREDRGVVVANADSPPVEFIGYLARAGSIKNLDSEGLYIIQTVMILVAPGVVSQNRGRSDSRYPG